MLGPDDLVLCAGSVARASFAEKLAAAAAGGFRGVSLFLDDLEAARHAGLRDADLRAALDGHGLEVAELDPLLSWVPAAPRGGAVPDEGEAFFRHTEDDFYRAAEALGGARSLNAVAYVDASVSRDALAEAFAGLCDRAAGHGLLVHLEFLPWTALADVDAALDVARRADRPNGGVMLDTWHHVRGGGSAASLAASLAGGLGARVLGVQLADAPAEAEPDPVEETLHRRRLPGAGDADLAGLVAALRRHGCAAPLGVEVFSDALHALPPEEAGRRAGAAARDVRAGAVRRDAGADGGGRA